MKNLNFLSSGQLFNHNKTGVDIYKNENSYLFKKLYFPPSSEPLRYYSLERLTDKSQILGRLALTSIQLSVFSADMAPRSGAISARFIGAGVGAGVGLINRANKHHITCRTITAGAKYGSVMGDEIARLPLCTPELTLKLPGELFRTIRRRHLIKPSTATPKSDALETLPNKGLIDKLLACKPASMTADEVKQVLLGRQHVMELKYNKETTLKSGTSAMTAIVWYLTAKGIACSGESYTKGTFNIIDSEHRLFNFMVSTPTCYGRISSHLANRSVSSRDVKIIFTQCSLLTTTLAIFRPASRQPVQYGMNIFSLSCQLPNGMLAVLFDKMKSEDPHSGKVVSQTMLKLETVGMPTVCRLFGHSDYRRDLLGAMGNAVLSRSRHTT